MVLEQVNVYEFYHKEMGTKIITQNIVHVPFDIKWVVWGDIEIILSMDNNQALDLDIE